MSKELFDKWLSGDDHAFSELYRHYFPALARFASRLTGNPSDGQDIAQEAFLRLQNSRQKIAKDGIENHNALIYTVVKRIAYNHASYKARWKKLETQTTDMINELHQTPPATPNELYEIAQIGAFIQTAVDKLPEPHREVILLRHIEDLSYQDIGAILGCSIDQVKSRLQYGRKMLRVMLTKMGIYPN